MSQATKKGDRWKMWDDSFTVCTVTRAARTGQWVDIVCVQTSPPAPPEKLPHISVWTKRMPEGIPAGWIRQPSGSM
jgi:hypothetical protein